eukprot:1560986-Lingulodinium_polyedra.AAC.1
MPPPSAATPPRVEPFCRASALRALEPGPRRLRERRTRPANASMPTSSVAAAWYWAARRPA